ncbi:MAG: Na+/H+ antiporter NhaC [Planctomycetota bacterium]|jgi:Na+/H+ antiporter NhaC
MVRALSILFVVLLVGALVQLPPANPARLATVQIADLLGEAPDGATAPEGEKPLSLAAQILRGKHTSERTDEGLKFSIFGARMVAEGTDEKSGILLHGILRDSIARGLRIQAASGAADESGEDASMSIAIPGQDMPQVGGASFVGKYEDGILSLEYQPVGEPALIASKEFSPPNKFSLFPPLIAIFLAILFRKPVPALFFGVFSGAMLLQHGAGAGWLASIGSGFVDIFGVFFWKELVDSWRAQTIGFVIFMLAMVGVITKNGGLRGLMDLIARRATSARNTQVATFLMGLAVFFDDYANTILVGSTMRPLTDRFRISREKLAYIVDSTAAPVAGISIFSTWIAYEVSTFSSQLPAAGLAASDGYAIFFQTLPYRFYCLFAIAMVAFVVFTGRDFGPMLKAEKRAREKGELIRPGGKAMVGDHATKLAPADGVIPKASRALLPLFLFIAITLFEIVRGGGGFDMSLAEWTSVEGFSRLIGAGGGIWPLFAGSMAGFVLAVIMSFAVGLKSEVAGAAWNTLRSMGIAIVILYLAWMIGSVCDDLGTASYLTELIGDSLRPELLPILLFLLAGVVAFATGSSWSTMGILLPLVVGLSYNLGEAGGIEHLSGLTLMVLSIGAVLEGAIFGDHCSPISDTTVLSSIATASDHIDHVRTQAPYAISTMIIAIIAGYFPCAFLGTSPYVGWLMGLSLLALLMFVSGKRVDTSTN